MRGPLRQLLAYYVRRDHTDPQSQADEWFALSNAIDAELVAVTPRVKAALIRQGELK